MQLKSQYLNTSVLLNNNVTFDSLSTWMSESPSSYNHVGFPIYKYLVARGYNIFQKSMRYYSWFDWPYFTTHIRHLVGFNEYGLEASNCLEWFLTCAFVAFLFALWNWGDRHPWHHMSLLSSSSSPFIRAWNQLHGETPTGNTAHYRVKWTNRVGSFWIDKYNRWWNSIGHIVETRQLWNNNGNITKEIHIQQLYPSYIYFIEWHSALNRQQRTSWLPNFTTIRGITTAC